MSLDPAKSPRMLNGFLRGLCTLCTLCTVLHLVYACGIFCIAIYNYCLGLVSLILFMALQLYLYSSLVSGGGIQDVGYQTRHPPRLAGMVPAPYVFKCLYLINLIKCIFIFISRMIYWVQPLCWYHGLYPSCLKFALSYIRPHNSFSGVRLCTLVIV